MVVLTDPTVALPTWRIVAAASIGNALEWFDLLVYGYQPSLCPDFSSRPTTKTHPCC
jgi:hypothetical protein